MAADLMTRRLASLVTVAVLPLAMNCIDHRSENVRTPTRVPATDLAAVTSDCPAVPPEGYFRTGELIMAYGQTPDPEFHLTDILIVVNGQPRFLPSQSPESLPPVFFREVVPAGRHTIQVLARLRGLGKMEKYRFQVPFSHSVLTDGMRPVCVDIHLSFKASAAPEQRPQMRAAEAVLPAAPN